MEVFVTGGTGVLGRPVVRSLLAKGHFVRVAARSEANEALIRELGATPVRLDLFDAAAVREAVRGVHAVLHLATRIPSAARMGDATIWAENNRIRIEGTHNLVEAAIAAGAEVFVYPSITLVYADGGASLLAEDAPLASTPITRSTLTAEQEAMRFTGEGRRGVVLRMANFYGPEAVHTRETLAYARKGIAPILGAPDAYMSYVWVDDAAAAVLAALERAPAGIYNVAEDAAATRAELTTALALAAGRRSLWRLPAFLARWMMGAELVEQQSRSQRVSNQAFKNATGWAPEVTRPSDGFARLR
ncbi:MAG TPA: NAD(P)-dependent oxidoreductase [Oscillatoriaceae cyanobacterium]